MVAYSWEQVRELVNKMAEAMVRRKIPTPIRAYGVPNGGIPVVALLAGEFERSQFEIVESPNDATHIVDDLIDSGATELGYKKYGLPFYALVDKRGASWRRQHGNSWISWPWERAINDTGAEENVRRILQFIGDDPTREGLLETPARVARSWAELFSGYGKDPMDVMKTFDGDGCDEMVLVKDIEFYSTCEHHMQPFHGRAHIAYVPRGRVIGVSKLARVLEIYSRRLQIQERLTTQVTSALMQGLEPYGAACVLEAQHFCMLCRGVHKQNSKMVTSSLTGCFRKAAARAELFQLIRN